MKQLSKTTTLLTVASALLAVLALTATAAHAQTNFRAELKRDVKNLQGTADSVGQTAGGVKKTAADIEAAAAKTKATAARVEGVANVASKGLGLLSSKIAFRPEEVEEFLVQHVVEKALMEQGVTVVNEDGPEVCNFRIYIGIDDDDDDDDGILDATDTDDYGNMDDVVGAKETDLSDDQIIEVNLDEAQPSLTENLPDTVKNQGIFIILEADNPEQVIVFRMDADSFSDAGAASTGGRNEVFGAHAFARRPAESRWGAVFSSLASFGAKVMAQGKPSVDKGKALLSSWLGKR